MTLKDCIGRGRDGGEMEPGRANEAEDLFDELEAEARKSMAPEQAAIDAGRLTKEILGRQVAEKRRQMVLQARVTARIDNQLKSYRNSKGEEDFGTAAIAHLDRDEFATFSNVEARRKAILGLRLHAPMAKVLETFRRPLTPRNKVRNKATLEKMTREVFGEETGDEFARDLARAWGETAELARTLFNAAGGRTPKRADWGMPQFHDTLRVRKVSHEEWRDFILPRLDRDKMIDELTGVRMSDARLELALRDVNETIRSDGFSKVKPSGFAPGRKLANRHADHRFLAFKDAKSWLEYQERFGAGDPFSIMVSHLDRMARDIAQLEILGPNPTATIRWLGQTVRKRANEPGARDGRFRTAPEKAEVTVKTIEDLYAHISGAANAPIDAPVARTFAGLRNLLVAGQLGSAAISAISDVAFSALTRNFNGLREISTLSDILKLLTPGVTDRQRIAVQSGLIAENWTTLAMAQARYVGETRGPEFTRRVSDFVLRASGLSPLTQANRWAHGLEFMGMLGRSKDLEFGDLPGPLQRTFANYGLGAGAWDEMRAADLFEHEGAVFLRPEEMLARDDLPPGRADELATRVLEMIQTETEFAVPTASLRARVAIVSDIRGGGVAGEIMKSTFMYKNFPVTLWQTHITRLITQGSFRGRADYALKLFVGTGLMGALAFQLKQIKSGKDPQSMVGEGSEKFWAAAIMQGGGLGIYGDFLFSDVNRFGGGLPQTIAGPVVGLFDDIRRLTVGNLMQSVQGENTNFGRETINFLRRYTPGGNIWYLQLGLDRLVFDQLQEAVDPGARQSFRRRQSRARRTRGQRFFFRPGQTVPDRFPNLKAAVEAR